jgi:hypothetical protein
MAITQLNVNTTTGWSAAGFTQGVVNRIEAEAYKMMYDEGLLAKLLKPVGNGQKGSAIIFPYFDPTTLLASYVVQAEATDMTVKTAITNASAIIVASEMGIRSDITDTLKESQAIDIPAELARQHGIAAAVNKEKHILGRMASGVTYTAASIAGITGTTPFTFAKYAAQKNKLDALALTVPGRKHAVVPSYSWYWTTNPLTTSTTPSSIFNVNGPLGTEVASKYYVSTLFGDIDVYTLGLAYMAAATIGTGYMFVTDGVGLWTPRDFRMEKQRDASARADEMVSTHRVGAKVLIPNYVAKMKMYNITPT